MVGVEVVGLIWNRRSSNEITKPIFITKTRKMNSLFLQTKLLAHVWRKAEKKKSLWLIVAQVVQIKSWNEKGDSDVV